MTPSHFTYLGVCYAGDNMVLGLSSANDPNATTTMTVYQSDAPAVSVPEPAIAPLMALGLTALYLTRKVCQ